MRHFQSFCLSRPGPSKSCRVDAANKFWEKSEKTNALEMIRLGERFCRVGRIGKSASFLSLLFRGVGAAAAKLETTPIRQHHHRERPPKRSEYEPDSMSSMVVAPASDLPDRQPLEPAEQLQTWSFLRVVRQLKTQANHCPMCTTCFYVFLLM